MKCDDVERSLSLYLSDELKLSEKRLIQDHLNECPSCREALALHRMVGQALDGPGRIPAGLQSKTLALIQPKQKAPWLARIIGDPKMRKYAALSAAAAVLAVSLFALAPQLAQASTAKETLSEMNSAIALAALRGEITLIVASTPEGQITVNGSMDGGPLPSTFPVDVKVQQEGDVATLEITIDFNQPQYESVAFGKDKNTLEVVPKGSQDRKYLVKLDPVTRLPLSSASLQKKEGQWKEVSRSSFRPRAAAPKGQKSAEHLVKATVKMHLGQTATLRIAGAIDGRAPSP